MQVDAGLQLLQPRVTAGKTGGAYAADGGERPHESRGAHLQRRKVNKLDELFEALMALIDGAQGMPHDPEDNKLLVEEAVGGRGEVLQQRVVG